MATTDPGKKFYERLEFLGDRVLNLFVSQYLFEKNPDDRNGILTNKMRFASNDNLAEIFDSLPDFFRNAVIEFKRTGSPDAQTVKGDHVEAYIGKYYRDYGFDETIGYLTKVFAEKIDEFDPKTDFISQLKEYCEEHNKPTPEYSQLQTEKGLNNQSIFHFVVVLGGVEYGSGTGSSHTKAKQQASLQALKKLGEI